MNKRYYLNACLLITCLGFLVSCGSAPVIQPTQPSPAVIAVTPSNELSARDLDKYHQAKGYIVSNQYKQARSILTVLSQKKSTHTGVLINLAMCEYKLKNYKKSQQILNQAFSYNKLIAQAYNLQGLLFIEEKNITKAFNSYKHALKLDNTLYNAHYNIALLYDIYFQDIPKAYQHYQQYLALSPIEDKNTQNWLEQLKHSL